MKHTILRPCLDAARHSAATPPPFIRRVAAPFICGGAAPFIRRAAALVILATLTVSAHAETVSIASAADWASFAGRINSGETALCAEMTADVTLDPSAPRVGMSGQSFRGTFDGAGHTLRVNWNLTGVQYAAPFSYVAGCTIRDLHVAGSISSDSQYAAGLVGYVKTGDTGIERCRCSATISLSVSGEAACGGFVGFMVDNSSCKVTIRNCLFDGSLLGLSATTCGGFAGAKPYYAYLYLYNDLFDPASVTVSDTGSATFSRGTASSYSYDKMFDCYYTRTLGAAQGSDATTMPADELASRLGAGYWTASDGKAMLKQFAGPPPSPPKPAVAGFVYQGVLRDAQGAVLAERSHEIAFRVYDAATGGAPLWGVSVPVLLDDAGLFNVALFDGTGSAIAGVSSNGLASVLSRNAGTTLYVGLAVGSAESEILPRQKLMAVPRAAIAADALGSSGDFAAAGGLKAAAVRVGGMAEAQGVRTDGDASVGRNLSVTGTITGLGALPLRGIVIWSGAINNIPDGWALCNGQTVNGQKTPDLRNLFVVGARGEYAVGATGGQKTVTLTVEQIPSHNHSYSFKGADTDDSYDDDNYFYNQAEKYDKSNTKYTNNAGGNQPHENRPPFYALCYIMRVR